MGCGEPGCSFGLENRVKGMTNPIFYKGNSGEVETSKKGDKIFTECTGVGDDTTK